MGDELTELLNKILMGVYWFILIICLLGAGIFMYNAVLFFIGKI